jgi:NAD-dependent dihydropyrimidine dehydrogenase PreA subunit
MASGRDAAAAVHGRLTGRESPGKRFTTVVGRLTEPEMSLYLEGAESREPVGRESRELSAEEAAGESGRCLLCACAATETCLLKRYGEELGADPRRFKVRRRLFTRNLDHPFVVYEPGKCIACGICVTLTHEMGEELGLTFIGRGFDVRVGVPFDEPLEDALRKAAERVVRVCPTGALTFKDRDRD